MSNRLFFGVIMCTLLSLSPLSNGSRVSGADPIIKKATRSGYTPIGKFVANKKYDCGEIRKDGIIGRHAFFKPYYLYDNGIAPCARYTEYFQPKAFEDVTVSFEYYSSNSVSMSFTEKIAYQAANLMNITAEIPGFVSADASYTFEKSHEYSKNVGFAYTNQNAIKTSFTVSKEASNCQNKKYAVGKVGRVYELHAQYYETHWLFWNPEEILEDTIKDFTAFICVDTYMDVIYEDGTYFE